MNEEEAKQVRAIFALFEENRSLLLTLAEVNRKGWRLKSWTRKTGQFRPGGPFAINSLRRLLSNIIYTGSIRHKGQAYPGEHAAILAHETWGSGSEADCSSGGVYLMSRSRNKHQALLGGLLYCEACAARMVYSSIRPRTIVSIFTMFGLNAQRRGWKFLSSEIPPCARYRGIGFETAVGRLNLRELQLRSGNTLDRAQRRGRSDECVHRARRLRRSRPRTSRSGSGRRKKGGISVSREGITYELDFRTGRKQTNLCPPIVSVRIARALEEAHFADRPAHSTRYPL